MTPQNRGLDTPMIDDVFAALSDWRRRAVCRYLATCEDSGVDVGTLAAAVARRAQASGVDESAATVEAVERALVETHLPELDRIGLLDFDERSRAVHYWGQATVEKWAEHAEAVGQHGEF
jgi:Mrp family chromosome partitioning ATPase